MFQIEHSLWLVVSIQKCNYIGIVNSTNLTKMNNSDANESVYQYHNTNYHQKRKLSLTCHVNEHHVFSGHHRDCKVNIN